MYLYVYVRACIVRIDNRSFKSLDLTEMMQREYTYQRFGFSQRCVLICARSRASAKVGSKERLLTTHPLKARLPSLNADPTRSFNLCFVLPSLISDSTRSSITELATLILEYYTTTTTNNMPQLHLAHTYWQPLLAASLFPSNRRAHPLLSHRRVRTPLALPNRHKLLPRERRADAAGEQQQDDAERKGRRDVHVHKLEGHLEPYKEKDESHRVLEVVHRLDGFGEDKV